MATDIILSENDTKITDGNLKVDGMFEAGLQFNGPRSHRLKFDTRGLVIRGENASTTIRSAGIFSNHGRFSEVHSNESFTDRLHLGGGKPSEPGSEGRVEVRNSFGNETVSIEGKSGTINCKNIHLETIGNLVEVIKQLQNEIRALKKG